RVSLAYKLTEKTVFKAGYGMYFDTLNAGDYTQNSTGYSSTTTNTNSTDFGQTFTLGNPYTGVLANADPFPLRGGVRFIQPVDDNGANPYNIVNLASLATSNPTLYNWIATNGFFTATTVPRNRLLRPLSQYATGTGLVFGDQPLGKAKVHALQINGTRRFANGLTANVALAFTRSEYTLTVEAY